MAAARNTLTVDDFLQLADLYAKAESDGLAYAVRNWEWIFDNPTLTRAAKDGDTDLLRGALSITHGRREAWRSAGGTA